MKPKFDLGKVTVSIEARYALIAAGQDADFFFLKHVTGDWGFCDPEAQERSLRERSGLVNPTPDSGPAPKPDSSEKAPPEEPKEGQP